MISILLQLDIQDACLKLLMAAYCTICQSTPVCHIHFLWPLSYIAYSMKAVWQKFWETCPIKFFSACLSDSRRAWHFFAQLDQVETSYEVWLWLRNMWKLYWVAGMREVIASYTSFSQHICETNASEQISIFQLI